ncbi:MAG: methyltransferase domain-containing protein, partial [Thermodesulfobacteriota bacterium]
MGLSPALRRLAFTACLCLAAANLFAQAQPEKSVYEPRPYQEGKDVVWVPTEQILTDRMLDMAKVTPQDYLIDLGSGDGRIVITAARRGARALGIEYDADLVTLSKQHAAKAGLSDRAQFVKADLFESDFSRATVITMFLLPELNLKLRPRILDLKPGTRIVSNSFDMAEWKADQTVHVTQQEGCNNTFCRAYLWIVPAKVDGTWNLPRGRLLIVQRFQRIFGELQQGDMTLPLANGRVM